MMVRILLVSAAIRSLLSIEMGLINCIVNPKQLDTVIRSACEAAIAAEPNLTKWDTISEFSLFEAISLHFLTSLKFSGRWRLR